MCDHGLYYNQDECPFCPVVFHLFAGSEHSEHWLARSACLPRCLFHLDMFPFWLLEAWLSKISGDRRGVKSSNIIQFCQQNLLCKRNHSSLYTNSLKALVFFSSNGNTVVDVCARIVDVCLFQVVISHCCGKLTLADIYQCRRGF